MHETGAFDLTLPHTDDFIAHMTLTEGLSGDAVSDALLSRLESEVNHGSFMCSEVTYLQPDSEFRFSVKRALPLGPG